MLAPPLLCVAIDDLLAAWEFLELEGGIAGPSPQFCDGFAFVELEWMKGGGLLLIV